MLYHYTSIQALEGILRESPSEKGLCFWASVLKCIFSDAGHGVTDGDGNQVAAMRETIDAQYTEIASLNHNVQRLQKENH